MQIEFYLDYLCPKCYLQHKTLEHMINQKQISQHDIIYRSFEMVDENEFDQGLAFVDFISKYKHLPKDEVVDFLRDTNLEIRLFPIHNVHKMAHLAKKEKKSYAFNKAVFKAMYEDRIDLSFVHELRTLSLAVGLSEDKVNQVICSNLYSDAVISNKENGLLKGVESLPFLRINRVIKLEGLQTSDIILDALRQHTSKKQNEHCIGENCSRKRIH